jgi:hypothetical protein
MFFNNPDVITSDTDIILGSVKADDGGLNFLTMMHRCKNFYAFHIRKDIEALMDKETSHRKALLLTANKIYSRLEMYEKIEPTDEEHLAELMMQSRNFEMWESDVKNRFFATHPEKVTVETKISSTGDGGFSQEEIKQVLEETNLDLILETLMMYMDIGTPTNN